MAATPLSSSSSCTSTNPGFDCVSKTLKDSFLTKKPSIIRLPKEKSQISCELRGFGDHRRWNTDYGSQIDHLNIIQSSSALPMAANAALDSLPKNSKKVCLFYCAETKALAERVAAESDAIELRSITWRTFEDGFPNLFITNAHGIRGQHVAFLASFSSPGERFYFGDNILPYFESGVPLLKNRLQQLPDSDNISIAFPDDGAWKRFHRQLQHFPTIVCNKVREDDQRIVRLKEGDPRGRHVVIVDDLVQSGGTLIECQKMLAAHGASKISAYVTHGIFPNRSWERFQHDSGGSPDNGLAYFWITDSCPLTVKEVKNRRPFEVLSLAGSIAAALKI
ncbi:PREDICTED: ribose-phosphate pyrophosphokinase 3, mitochondrial isoform X2 [Nelumbo nucifera]|uniref:Ribose-phosphate pyrophosphokinase 3, mitochondrial isoform X2 n=1 Tax=Nelumbo nucifera TaxID=4432 RepID=A0A1U8Q3D1_NELNU|nr:PREDICTED: ribose-phosphate pyrophosphokinase 3, mitochondrial isoform X2 [Nelumbo nucifera]